MDSPDNCDQVSPPMFLLKHAAILPFVSYNPVWEWEPELCIRCVLQFEIEPVIYYVHRINSLSIRTKPALILYNYMVISYNCQNYFKQWLILMY